MKKGFLLIPFASIAFANDYQIHILKENETLSGLLKEKGYTPLYGKNNWVDKTLQMNHLSNSDAAKIKKGFPIILPGKAEVADQDLTELAKDFVKTSNAAVMRAGIFGNTISDHQSVFIDLDYYSNTIAIDDNSIQLNENFGLGFRVEGKNNYHIGNLTYNHNGSFFIYSHGSGQFDNIEGISSSFQPTYRLNYTTVIQAPEISFQFGPDFNLEERSRLFKSEGEYQIGRDRTGWIGFRANKIYEIDHLKYETSFVYSRKVMQQTLDNTDTFAASNIQFQTKVNLSQDYDLGLKFNSIQYDNIGIKRENALGFNLSYNLK